MKGNLLTIPQAATTLGLKNSTLRSWILNRKIQFVKLGAKSVRIRETDLDQFIAAGLVPAKPSADRAA